MIYETYSDLARRVRSWCRTLPEFVAVAGIPRAGQIVAAMIAGERNIHLIQIEDLVFDKRPWAAALRRNCPAKADGPVLVVDDTVSSGAKMLSIRGAINNPAVQYGAVYAQQSGLTAIDHYACPVGFEDHLFEWNWNHHWYVEQMLFDMDGVLCADWPHGREDGDLAPAYLQHLENAPCLMRPSFKIGEIVTARLEQWRPQTEAWLARHGIQYHSLNMAPYATIEERERNGGHGERKAAVYSQRPWAKLFVESCPHQAAIIAGQTGRPVLSWPQNLILNGVVP